MLKLLKQLFSKKNIIPIIILAILVFIYFSKIIINLAFPDGDFPLFYFPLKLYIFQELKNGHLPLWQPGLSFGYPIIADTAGGVLYPLNWLAIPFVNNNISWNYLVIEIWVLFHILLAGIFIYWLVNYLLEKNFSTTRNDFPSINIAALISAITFMFSGFFVGHLTHGAPVISATWLPLIFLYLHKSFSEQKLINAVYAGIFWALAVFGGHLHIVYIFSLWLTLYIGWEVFSAIIKKQNYKQKIFFGFIAIITALSLSAAHTLPFIEFLKLSTRKEITTQFASSYSMSPGEFLTNLFLPHAFGGFKPGLPYTGHGIHFGETATYIGIFSLLMVIIAVKNFYKNKLILFLILSSLFFISLSFGRFFLIHPLLLNILPGLNMIRVPARFILPFVFCASILVGFGFNKLLLTKLKLNQIKTIKLFHIDLTVLLKILLIADLIFFIITVSNKTSYILNNFLSIALTTFSLTLIFYLLIKEKIKIKSAMLYLIVVIMADLMFFGFNANNGIDTPKDYYPPQPILNKLKQQEPLIRIINNNILMQNSPYVYNIPDMRSVHYMNINDYNFFIHQLINYYDKNDRYNGLEKLFTNKYIINLLGVNHIISSQDLSEFFQPVEKNIYRNTSAYPRFLLSKQAIYEPDSQHILEKLKENYNPFDKIYINESFQLPVAKNENKVNNINILDYQPEKIRLDVESQNNQWLLTSEIFYPGWQAYIDDKPIKVYKANYTFRAIPVPAGKHLVEFIFEPNSYFLGRKITIISLLFLIILSLIKYKRLTRRAGRLSS